MFAMLLPYFNNFAITTCKHDFFGLQPWYQYLQVGSAESGCSISGFTDPTKVLGGSSPILLIGLAILDDLIRVAALVAVGFVVYGGIQYVTSQGSPDATKKAQQTIVNALIGVAIAVLAAALVSYIGTKLGNLS